MNQFDFATLAAHASIEAPGLIISHVISGVSFAIFVLAWQPNLNINTTSVWLADIICTLADDAIWQDELLDEPALNSNK